MRGCKPVAELRLSDSLCQPGVTVLQFPEPNKAAKTRIGAIWVLLDSGSHQTLPEWPMARENGNCSPKQLEGTELGKPSRTEFVAIILLL